MKLGTKEIPALRLGAAAVLKAYLGGSQVWPLGFDPASLFAQGEHGVWYDPSDFSTMFQDAAGTTPVTAVEQPVGLMLDKSGSGNHASQPTATSRPILSARYNLLTKTEQFDDAVWTGNSRTVTANQTIAPNGTTTADLVTLTANGGAVRQNVAPMSATDYTLTFYAKTVSGTLSFPAFVIGGNGIVAAQQTVNLTTEWQQFTLTATVAAGQNGRVQVGGSGLPASGSQFYIWGASLVPADQADLPYQRVNTETDYDTVGFPHYLRFDGVDDFLVTPTITPGIDKVQVFAGVRKLMGTTAVVAELSANFNTSAGAFAFYSSTVFELTNHSEGFSGFKTSALATTFTGVFAAVSDLSLPGAGGGEVPTLRLNGASDRAAAVSIAHDNTGNFGNHPLYIGRRGGTTLPFEGHIYSMIVRFGSNLPIETIEQAEAWINSKTGAY